MESEHLQCFDVSCGHERGDGSADASSARAGGIDRADEASALRFMGSHLFIFDLPTAHEPENFPTDSKRPRIHFRFQSVVALNLWGGSLEGSSWRRRSNCHW